MRALKGVHLRNILYLAREGWDRVSKMTDIKVFRIKGGYNKRRTPHVFSVEIRALNEQQALELAYSEIGSKHRVKRTAIKITSIEEITNPEEITDPIVQVFAERDDFEIRV